MEQRVRTHAEREMNVALALAQQFLEQDGKPVTPASIEREAGRIAQCIYVQGDEDGCGLAQRALQGIERRATQNARKRGSA